jgi:multidrug transporter EmrE-like cation transporter
VALFIYVVAFVIWIVSLSRIEFSVAIPFNIITVVIGGIFGYYVFNESLSLIRIISYLLIIFGVIMLSWDALNA